MKQIFTILIFIVLGFSSYASANPTSCYEDPCYPKWFVLMYFGKMADEDLGRILALDFAFDRDTLYSLEIGRELPPASGFRQFFQPFVNSVDVRMNFTLQNDYCGNVIEFNPYFACNWRNFPWRRYISTTLSVGEGISYVSRVPFSEIRQSDQSKKLLNFLVFEIGLGLPTYSCLEVVIRLHHRSGAFGLYHANNTGSTAIGLALRYRF